MPRAVGSSVPHRKVRIGCWARGDLYALFIQAYLKIQVDECSPGQKRDSGDEAQELTRVV